ADLAEVVERRAFARLVANLTLDGQALFEVAQRRVVVPPCVVELAEVVERRAFVSSSWGNREGTLKSSQGTLRQAQHQLTYPIAGQCPPGRRRRDTLHDFFSQGSGCGVIADTIVETTDVLSYFIGNGVLSGLAEVVDGFDIIAPAA